MAREQLALTARPLDADALYRAHVRPLYAFIYRKVGNRETAEDMTGDVFMKVLAHLDLGREEHSIVAWLYRVARNAVVDYWRVGRNVRLIPLEDARVALRPAELTPLRLERTAATAARAVALLERLPQNYRTVLAHRLLEGWSVAETARCMGLSETNVKVLQHRALKRAAELPEDEAAHVSDAAPCQTRRPRPSPAGVLARAPGPCLERYAHGTFG